MYLIEFIWVEGKVVLMPHWFISKSVVSYLVSRKKRKRISNMSDWHPCICRIQKIEKHPNADTLSIYTVLNEYPVVDKTGKFNVDDLVAYICSDSIVPDLSEWQWLAKKDEDGNPIPLRVKDRIIKARKLRNVYSEGIILPAPSGFNEGDSVIEHYGLVKKQDDEEMLENSGSKYERNEVAPKSFQLFKYDLE